MPSKSMIHLNNHILCVIDTETTGDHVGFHDLIEICVLPLDSELKPNFDLVPPFHALLKPKRPENCMPEVLEINREKVCEATLKGVDPGLAEDLFYEWYCRLGLAENKRIIPLAQNWPFDSKFILDWLGHGNFTRYFDGRYRDTMVVALFLQDRADFRAEPYPFQKVGLQSLCTTLGIERTRIHDALDDAIVTAECYRRMVLR